MLNDTPPAAGTRLARERPPARLPAGVRHAIWGLVVLAVVLAVWGTVIRVQSRKELARETLAAAVPLVTVLHPTLSPPFEQLVLPGNVQAFIETPIYARVTGYLRRSYADIGTPVKKGQVLAVMDTPELDQELKVAIHDFDTARANARLAARTNRRWQALLAQRAVSQQDADRRAAAAKATAAAEAAARAKVQRLREMESFKRVVAPFDGVVSYRNTDLGLITAGAPGTALFRVADEQTLRVYVQVPEPYAAQIHAGVVAGLELAQYPQQRFQAMVVRTAQALDPTTRTLQVELHVDNHKGLLPPGAYAKVHFRLPGRAGTLRIPVSALLFRSTGLQVATVGPDLRVKLKEIVQGRDFGRSVEVLSGLTARDEVIANPPGSVMDGMAVRLARADTSAVPLP